MADSSPQPVPHHAEPQLTGDPQDPTPTGTSTTSEVPGDEPRTLTKSALKKAAKAERIAALKLERRAREKEAKKEKKRQRADQRAAGELGEEDEEAARKKKKQRIQFGGRVVLDLGFDDKMNDKEISSLCSQLAYTYSANRNASFPFSLLYTSLNGRTFARLEGMSDASYKRWSNTEWWHEGYDRLWTGRTGSNAVEAAADSSKETGAMSSKAEGKEEEAAAESQITRQAGTEDSETANIRNSIVYLTADSEEELTELKPEETYIIGGVCDRNRYKNLCRNKANDSGVRTARLPIGRYLAELPTRKVLTVNQVFEILLKWVETKNWEEALYTVVPKRKFHVGGKAKTEGNDINIHADEEGSASGDKEKDEDGIEKVVVSLKEMEQDA